MKLTKEEGQEMVWGDNPDFETVESSVSDTSRWSVHYDGVFKHLPSGKHYSASWSVGATESQDESPFEYEDEVTIYEVVAREVIVTQWVGV